MKEPTADEIYDIADKMFDHQVFFYPNRVNEIPTWIDIINNDLSALRNTIDYFELHAYHTFLRSTERNFERSYSIEDRNRDMIRMFSSMKNEEEMLAKAQAAHDAALARIANKPKRPSPNVM